MEVIFREELPLLASGRDLHLPSSRGWGLGASGHGTVPLREQAGKRKPSRVFRQRISYTEEVK